jgi:methionyl-tRNA formyltransferase
MTDARIIFAGTPEFAAVSLRALVESGVTPVAVLTQPDRPAGRGKRLKASPVKEYALAHDIDVLQPESLRGDEIDAQLTALQADIMVVAAYGLLLPQRVLDIPRTGCLNVHASLLPRWRGAAPIQAAILAADEETGVCLMSMTAGLDCGPVFVSETLQIGADENAGELHDRLAAAGGTLLVGHLADIIDSRITAAEQNEAAATYAHKIKTSDACIDWQRPAAELVRLVRAFNPVPGAYFMLGDERIKCWQAAEADADDSPAGTIIEAGPDGVVVVCGHGALRLIELQRPGKRPVSAAQFTLNTDIVGRKL